MKNPEALYIRNIRPGDQPRIALWLMLGGSYDRNKDNRGNMLSEGRTIFVAADVETDKPLGTIEVRKEGKIGHISRLIVAPRRRRKRIGTQLVEAAETYLENEGCKNFEILVDTNNRRARKFWKARGYYMEFRAVVGMKKDSSSHHSEQDAHEPFSIVRPFKFASFMIKHRNSLDPTSERDEQVVYQTPENTANALVAFKEIHSRRDPESIDNTYELFDTGKMNNILANSSIPELQNLKLVPTETDVAIMSATPWSIVNDAAVLRRWVAPAYESNNNIQLLRLIDVDATDNTNNNTISYDGYYAVHNHKTGAIIPFVISDKGTILRNPDIAKIIHEALIESAAFYALPLVAQAALLSEFIIEENIRAEALIERYRDLSSSSIN